MAILSRPMAVLSRQRLNGRFIKDLRPEAAEWPDLQFGLQMASFTQSRIKNLSAAGRAIFIKASPSGHFVKAASLNGRFIKAGQAQWPFYEGLRGAPSESRSKR